jgi:hypothetical protein
VAQDYPAHIIGQVERRWERHFQHAALRAAQAKNDNYASDGLCPICKGYASIGSKAEYRGKGTVHRHWLCRACGHEWITVLHVLA